MFEKNTHTHAAGSTPFPLNIYNFANFTNSNKSFYTDIVQSIYFEKMQQKNRFFQAGLPEYPVKHVELTSVKGTGVARVPFENARNREE